MKANEILCELRKLELYSLEEWQEYFDNFSLSDSDINHTTTGESILSRIKIGLGVTPALVDPQISTKITTLENFEASGFRNGVTLGVVSGCFDLLHLGHVRSMNFAKEYLSRYKNPKLVALVLSDEEIKAKKGSARPILDINERLELICATNSIDYALVLKGSNCLDPLNKLRPNYYFKSSYDRSQPVVRQEMELVESYGGKTVVFPRNENKTKSTTDLIKQTLEKLTREF